MDVRQVIKSRLEELGFDQKQLATAARVTESYVSQLLNRKRVPPAPDRTDIYETMGRFLKFPRGQLAKLAYVQRMEELKRAFESTAAPLFESLRELVLGKCSPAGREQMREIFARQPFGEIERLVSGQLMAVAKSGIRAGLHDERWVHKLAEYCGWSPKRAGRVIREFLDTDLLSVTAEQCDPLLSRLIERWELDLASFSMEITLNQRLVSGHIRRFVFAEQEAGEAGAGEPGLTRFLEDRALSSGITPEELAFLQRLKFRRQRPEPLYYYRELQNLRDPMHFSRAATLNPY